MSVLDREVRINFEGHLKKGSVEEQLFQQIDCQRIPRHVAIIMDGNGRWAQKRRLPRVAGHRAGIHSVRETVETAARLKMQVLTLYAFSVENWKRPAGEVATLMRLLKEFLKKELKTLLKNNIRFETLGRINELDPSIQKELALAKARTAANTGLLFNVALNYGGRAELVDAVKLFLDRGPIFERLRDRVRFVEERDGNRFLRTMRARLDAEIIKPRGALGAVGGARARVAHRAALARRSYG